MICGTGIDLVQISRIRKMLAKYGDSFTGKIFTEDERRESEKFEDPAPYFAGRWAAKEALSKALGSGIGPDCAWTDISVRNMPSGSPFIEVSGCAKASVGKLGATSIHVSITHEGKYSAAMVVLEK